MDLYFTRQQVTGEAFQAWGAITYAHPLTEREMQDYELRPSRNNLDIRRQMDAQAQVVGRKNTSPRSNWPALPVAWNARRRRGLIRRPNASPRLRNN